MLIVKIAFVCIAIPIILCALVAAVICRFIAAAIPANEHDYG